MGATGAKAMSALSRIKLAEMERLRAENERLQAALRQSATAVAATTTNLLPNKLRLTAGIEDMAGRPFTAGQLREAADAIASLERERDELRAKWEPLVTWAAAKEKAGKGES
jgi:hypothetical protein